MYFAARWLLLLPPPRRIDTSARSLPSLAKGTGAIHAQQFLGLTKADRNNNTLYKAMPVTLVYSSRFANVVKLAPEIPDQEYDCRFLM
jgi:hypothetical protein